MLAEHNSFKEKAKETREKVKLLLTLAETLVDKGHVHAQSIKKWVEEVDATYKDFSTRMDTYRSRLENTLGIQNGEASMAELSLDGVEEDMKSNKSSSSSSMMMTTTTVTANASAATATSVTGDLKQIVNEEKRRSARRREFIMAELLDTERSYVKDLELTVKCFKQPLEAGGPDVPQQLRGKTDVVFGNIEEILLFHKSTFLKELEKYETMAEDVGHCFVTWVRRDLPLIIIIDSLMVTYTKRFLQAQKFDIYVKYCTNKPESTQILVAHGGPYFDSLRRMHSLEHPIAAYLIKPVQRITKYQVSQFSHIVKPSWTKSILNQTSLKIWVCLIFHLLLYYIVMTSSPGTDSLHNSYYASGLGRYTRYQVLL